ncbi:uncharacterized protein LOC129598046 [Paramacrobiotus metropolitanus]|uniref:uncharacterized protein LOC129598046 n=1 Tax=Paramacrobiotus metropolitanus TaxID=2943436 RepID=UPI002445E0DE|nr:uncharacterized protein LOC129598046 [Paramacrobiotus metropolitanus]
MPYGSFVQIMMDYAPDRDSRSLLKDLKGKGEKLQLSSGADFGKQITRGLVFLHANDITHTDMKPANVLLRKTSTEEYHLFIGDLDTSVFMEHSYTTSKDPNRLLYTAPYMSPEMAGYVLQTEATARPGRKTDVWSMGCILIALVNSHLGTTDQWLEKGDTKESFQITEKVSSMTVVFKVKGGFRPVIDRSTHQGIRELIENCLRDDAEQRFSAASVLDTLEYLDL